MNEDILVMENITKVYPNGFAANKKVSLSVRKGEIHALVGENGAGKSTLMKVLFGIEKPEEGRIIYKGKPLDINNPLQAIAVGIGMVHQHFMLVPSLTVAENIILGIEPKSQGFFSFKKAVEMTREISEKYNFHVDPMAKAADLSVGQKQKVEILKALIRGADVLILDEPTAVLTPQETKELFVQLRSLKENGHTIIFISHKLQEVISLCDRYTVLRSGTTVSSGDIAGITEQEISRMMVGRDVILKINKKKARPQEIVLKAQDLVMIDFNSKIVLKNISFNVRKGEILGIAGVEGNGQRELTEIITNMYKATAGKVFIGGQDIENYSIRQVRELKVSHISEDRMIYGVVSNGTIMENTISDRYYKKEFNRNLLLDFKKTRKLSEQLIKDYNIYCDGYDQPIRMLSGGNMQKVVAAREFSGSPQLIIANQPTRGIDVGASEFIRNKLVSMRDEGCAVLLITADLNEVLEVSDSLIVMCDGEIVAYFDDVSTLTEDELGEYMLGLKKQDEDQIRRAAYEQ